MSVTDAGDSWDVDGDKPPAVDDKAAKEADARANRLEAQFRTQQKKLEEATAKLAEYESRQRKGEVAAALKEAGLPEGMSAAWLAMNPDQEVSPENVAAFAETLGIAPQASTDSSAGEPKPPQPAGSTPDVSWHNPSVAGTTIINPPKMSFKELDAKMRTNQMEAREDIKNGRVELDVEQIGPGTWGAKTKGT